MNKNRNLKIVWMIGSVAILLLFCTQAYWLYNQYQYSIERSVEQFEKDCDQVVKEEFRTRKALSEKKSMKNHEHRMILKVESKLDLKKAPSSMTTISYWDNKKFIGKVRQKGITADDAYELCSRYLAWLAKRPSCGDYQIRFKAKGYDEIGDFRQQKYKDLFLDVRYETRGTWGKTVVAHYQTNPIFHEGISFVVNVSAAEVLKTMLWQLVGSILLFAILACCLYYLVKTIVFQKRIDALRHEFLKSVIYEMKQPKKPDNADEDVVAIGSISFSYAENELRNDNGRVIITSRQAEILKLLASHQNQLVEREIILNEVWGDDSYSNSLALNVQITYLRRALSLDASVTIEPVIKKGYILKVNV